MNYFNNFFDLYVIKSAKFYFFKPLVLLVLFYAGAGPFTKYDDETVKKKKWRRKYSEFRT